jgi:hypothetical protein
MNRKIVLPLIAATVLVSGCQSGGVFDRERPDEFAVQRQAPLVVPPDFNMVPPAAGTPRPATEGAAQEALEALFGGPAPRSAVETSLLDRAGAADPAIRSVIGDPETRTVDKGVVTREILAAPQGDGRFAQVVVPQ